MMPEQESSKAFIETQLEALKPQIAQAKIMQRAWRAGGDAFKENMENVSKALGAWLAVEEDMKNQLAEISSQ